MEFSEGSSSEILERLSTAYGVETQKQLAEKLGVSAANVSNWVQRNSVPGSAFVRCALDTECDLAWLATGKFAKANHSKASLQQVTVSGKELINSMLASGGKAVLQRVLGAYGFKTQKELSEHFGISTGTISTWIRREYFPGEIVIACALDTGVSLAWLAIGQDQAVQDNTKSISKDPLMISKKSLKDGKLIPAGKLVVDESFLPIKNSSLEFIQSKNAAWIIDFSRMNIGNGKWLLDIDGNCDIYMVSIQPLQKVSVKNSHSIFICEKEQLKVIGKVISTINYDD